MVAKHNNDYCKPIIKSAPLSEQDSRGSRAGIRKICLVLMLVLIVWMIAGCNGPQDSQPAGSGKSTEFKRPTANNKSQEIKKPVKTEIDWQGLAEAYNPPKIDSLLGAIGNSEVAADGSIAITADIKREFNQMGADYHFFFLPVVDWYNFESTGEAISYILFTWNEKFGTFPESAPKYEAEAKLRKLFAAKSHEYPRLEHKTYTKLVTYDGKGYTLWPESYNDNTMVYDLTGLKVRQEGLYKYYTAIADEYQFDTSGSYEPGDNEKIMFMKAQEWSLNYPATLARLLENGEISAAAKRQTYTIQFRIEGNNTTPMLVSVNKVVF
ncbi:MAG: hypothetical protein ABFD18_03370 [Syntrophomonas sp.]